MAIDVTNPVKKTEYARSQGFDGWDQYLASGGSATPGGGGSTGGFLNLRNMGNYQLDPSGQYSPTPGSYLADADVALRDYYKQLLALEQGDVEKAKTRLLTDYQSGRRVTMEDYTLGKQRAQETAQADTANQQLYNVQESRANQDDLLQRGISLGGTADSRTADVQSRQDLRRQAIDRALKKSEEDLSYGKERDLESITKTQTRGTEDLVTDFSKFKMQQDQERKEKGMQLAESAYNRDLSKQSIEKGFEFQQKSLDLQNKGE